MTSDTPRGRPEAPQDQSDAPWSFAIVRDDSMRGRRRRLSMWSLTCTIVPAAPGSKIGAAPARVREERAVRDDGGIDAALAEAAGLRAHVEIEAQRVAGPERPAPASTPWHA